MSHSNASLDVSQSFTTTDVLRKRQRWLWTAAVLVSLCLLGGWTQWTVQSYLAKSIQEELVTILQADMEALEIWFDAQRDNAVVVSSTPDVRAEVLALAELAASGADVETLKNSEPLQRLEALLVPALKAYDYDGFGVLDPTGRLIGSQHRGLVGHRMDRDRMHYIYTLQDGDPVVTVPFLGPAPDASGKTTPMMFTAAPIRVDGKFVVALGFRISPRKGFTRILEVARSGDTGETYAFDDQGTMLSQSRFTEESQEKTLTQGEHSIKDTVLRWHVRDPGGDTTRGFKTQGPIKSRPLTEMAARAVQEKTDKKPGNKDRPGFEVEGYRDYRGVRVVGAWKWLHRYDFGVATEVDYAEAFETSRAVLWIFWTLFGLVVLGALAALVVSRSLEKMQTKLRRADRKVERLGSYSLQEKIGQGGMGEVYRATHRMLRRPTAVKLLRSQADNENAVVRFEREVQITSQLIHPNTIAIYDFGRNPDGVFYYAMEYVDGFDLKQVVAEEGPLPAARVIHILRQAC
ncbi:MAG: cache domain-containing protein, partial [Planctomycetales bacterium]